MAKQSNTYIVLYAQVYMRQIFDTSLILYSSSGMKFRCSLFVCKKLNKYLRIISLLSVVGEAQKSVC